MISLTSAQLQAWIAAFVWPLARILALLASAPVIGNPGVPARVKIALGVLITVAVAPLVPGAPDIEPASATGMLVLAQQVMVGLAMGFAMQIVFQASEFAGEIIGLQMGLGFATLYDYSLPGQIPVIGQYLGMILSLVFLAIDGHLLLISALAESFRVLPLSPFTAPAGLHALVDWSSAIFSYGLALSLPLLAALLITNIALGVLSRAAPQLNLFAVGFPATILIGMLMLGLAMPYFAPAFASLWHEGFSTMLKLAAGLR